MIRLSVLLAVLALSAAPGVPVAATDAIPVAGTCRVVSTMLHASYQGSVEAMTDRAGNRRMVGFLSMVEADRVK